LKRIKALAVPPAWTDAWICPKPNGHNPGDRPRCTGTQAIPLPRPLSEDAGEHEVPPYAALRQNPAGHPQERKGAHLALRGLPREKVLATVVQLLEATLIRVGSDEYARDNKSYGLTTLKNRHVDVSGTKLRCGAALKAIAPEGRNQPRGTELPP
jgi:DNA topoisomerase-1